MRRILRFGDEAAVSNSLLDALTDFPRIPGRMRRRLAASTRKTRIMVSKRPLKMKEVLCRG